MAAADVDFDFVLKAVRRLLAEIEAKVETRHKKGDRGAVLAEHVLQVLSAIEKRVDAEEERYPRRRDTESSKKAGARELRFHARLVWSTHCALLWLRTDDSQLLDLGALYFADEIALALLGPGVEVTPVESSEYMYSTSTWPFNWVREEQLGEELQDGDRPIPIVLAFPAHARHTMLLHCLFAHEIGHAAAAEKGLVERGLAPLNESGEYDSWLDEAVSGAGAIGPLIRAPAEERAALWLEELFCDALAFGLLGPSYLFSFAEMGLSVGWAKPDEEHPSMTLRTKLLLEFSARHRWSSYMEAEVPEIWQWLSFVAAEHSVVSTEIESFAQRVCESSLGIVLDLVEEELGEEDLFTPERWGRAEAELTKLLANDVLPVEHDDGSAAGHAEILMASWLQALKRNEGEVEPAPTAISAAIGEDRYQRFVAKALEMSTTLRVWQKVKAA
jgi:hypothetical protein